MHKREFLKETLCQTLTNGTNEDHVSSLLAHKLRLYLKQHNLQVSGGKASLVLEPEDNDATSDSELQSRDSEDPDDSEDNAQSDS